jgi:hypothetical protein
MTSAEPKTCGEGLAANAMLPEILGSLMEAMADLFSAHVEAMDSNDPSSRPEIDAYTSLSRGHREAATQLAAIAGEMAGYRTLPQAEHDPAAMQRQQAVFERVLEQRSRLLALLRPVD